MTSLFALWLLLAPNLGEEALRYASLLASTIGPRPTGSAPAKRAADEIFAQLRSCGYEPQRQALTMIERPGVEVAGQHFLPPMETHLNGQNIWARLGPEGEPAILLGAHYDSVSMQGPGARDNAAGVGVMLSVACSLRKTWSSALPLVFVAFDAEEINLLGSAAFVREAPAGDIALALSLDVLGDDHLSLNGLSLLVGTPLLSAALRAANESDVEIEAPLAQMVISRLLPQAERSDHGPFTAAKIPALQLYSRGGYGFDTHYHAAEDTTARLSAKDLDDAARWITAFLPLVPDALKTNVPGESLPVGSYVVPRRLLWSSLLSALLLSMAALVITLRRAAFVWREVARSLLTWTAAAVGLTAMFFLPFLAGRLWTGFYTPWLAAISWYTWAGASCTTAAGAAIYRWEGARSWLRGSRRFLLFSQLWLSLAVASLWWIGSMSAAAPVALALMLVSLGSLSSGRGRWMALAAPATGAALLSPWRYVEGTLTGTLAASGWIYVLAFWGVLWTFGAAMLGALPPEQTRRPAGRWLIGGLGVGLLLTLVAVTSQPYTQELPRRVEVRLHYGDTTHGEVIAWRGESLQGLTLQTTHGTLHLAHTRERFPISPMDVAKVEATMNNSEITVRVQPQREPFAQTRLDYKASKDGRPTPFRYRARGGEWQEVSSPLGLRVGFYGVDVIDSRDIELPEGASLEVHVLATLRDAPESISWTGDATLWEVSAVFAQTIRLR